METQISKPSTLTIATDVKKTTTEQVNKTFKLPFYSKDDAGYGTAYYCKVISKTHTIKISVNANVDFATVIADNNTNETNLHEYLLATEITEQEFEFKLTELQTILKQLI